MPALREGGEEEEEAMRDEPLGDFLDRMADRLERLEQEADDVRRLLKDRIDEDCGFWYLDFPDADQVRTYKRSIISKAKEYKESTGKP